MNDMAIEWLMVGGEFAGLHGAGGLKLHKVIPGPPGRSRGSGEEVMAQTWHCNGCTPWAVAFSDSKIMSFWRVPSWTHMLAIWPVDGWL